MHPENLSTTYNPGNAALPIFFVQLGSKTNLFLDKVLKQAELSNGKENVFVLTDTNFHLYTEFNCIDVSTYIKAGRPFDAIYKHHSTNPYHFEKACFDRWFIINDIVQEYNIANFFHADCDVLVMEDLKPVYDAYLKDKYDGTVMFLESNGDSVTSGHASFWNHKLLDDFCSFVYNKYANDAEFDRLLKDTLAGKFLNNRNVSDMILLDAFRTEAKPSVLNIFSLQDEHISFDFNMNIAYNGCEDNYLLSRVFHIKKMKRIRGSLFGCTVAGTSSHKFYTLHFQGYLTKALIPLFLTKQTFYGYTVYYLLGLFNFMLRKMKLLKTRLRGKLKNAVGK